jgi:hypothetical protein
MSEPLTRRKNYPLATTNKESSSPSGTTSGFSNDGNLANKSSMNTIGDVSNAIAQPDVTPETRSQEITGFIDDATTMNASLPHLVTPSTTVISDSMESRIHTIVDVLSRPVNVATGIWSTSSLQGNTILSLDFPQAIFDKSVNVVDKLNFFAFFRADVCIRVMVNANTFQQGKLLGYFTPFTQYVGERANVSNFLTSKTAFPHVIIDASTGNSANLVIPYVAPYSSYRLFDKTGNIGSFFLVVLNELFQENATYTVQAWFTNISVDLPSGLLNNLTPTSAVLNNVRRAMEQHGEERVTQRVNRMISKFKAQVAGEAEQKSSGIISSTFHQIHEIAKLGTNIPVIADVPAPVSWVAKAIAAVAEYFGYSKNQDLKGLYKMGQVPAYGFTNASGLDSGTVLGCTQDNSIEPRGDLFGSSVDDMDISAVCARRCWVDSFVMTTTSAVGDSLYSFPVAPGWCKYEPDEKCYQPTTTAFVASMFNFWRGGLRYKIQAAKTAYHSGRVRIIYIPGSFNSSVDSAEQAYNWVFDLRNQSEIEFSIPYNNILEWQPCNLTNQVESQTSIGTIRIEVFNQLRAPDSVLDRIHFNIWIAGESDLQFAVPTFQRYVPSLPNAPTFKAQVLGTAQDQGFNDMVDKPRLFETSHTNKIDPCKYSIGEYVSNLRYLTRRFAPTQNITSLATGPAWSFPNYYFGSAFNPGGASPDDITNFKITPVEYISYLYRFFRGGMRWKAMYSGPVTAGGYQEFLLAHGLPTAREASSITTSLYDRLFKSTNTFIHRTFNTVNPVAEVTVPFYSQVPVRAIVGTDVAQPSFLEDSATIYKVQTYSGSGSDNVEVFRAASDDFSFGWLVGPPRLRPRDGLGFQLDFSGLAATDLFYSNGNFLIENVPQEGTDPLPIGNYKIVASTAESIPVLFNSAAGTITELYPTTDYIIISVQDPNSYSLLNNSATEPSTSTGYNEALTLASLQGLGVVGFDLVEV